MLRYTRYLQRVGHNRVLPTHRRVAKKTQGAINNTLSEIEQVLQAQAVTILSPIPPSPSLSDLPAVSMGKVHQDGAQTTSLPPILGSPSFSSRESVSSDSFTANLV